MKKVLFSFVVLAAAAAMTACGNKNAKNVEGQDSTAVAAEEAAPQMAPMGTWDYPEGSALADAENISVLLYPHSWKKDIDAGKDPASDIAIYYNCNLVKAGDVQSTIKTLSDEYDIPNSLIIPIYKDATAKKGDIVLTWWQNGSGMQRAIVVDAANPAEPKIHYLDLQFKGDGTGTAEKNDNQTLKPNSFIVLKNGEWTNCSKNDGAKTWMLELEAKESRDGSQYRCVITDKFGNEYITETVTLHIIYNVVSAEAVQVPADATVIDADDSVVVAEDVAETVEVVDTIDTVESVDVETVESTDAVVTEDVAEVSEVFEVAEVIETEAVTEAD